MSIEAGWYHAQGDPEGTVRRWNGAEWIGYPIKDPALQQQEQSVDRFVPTPGQVLLKPFAIAAQLALIAVIGVYAMRLWVTFKERSYQVALNDDALLGIETTREQLDSLRFTQTFLWLGAIFILFIFGTLWFWRAMRNMRLWHKKLDRKTKLYQFTPLFMMLELQTYSPRSSERGVLNPVVAWGWWALFAGAGAVERAIERSSYGSTDTAVSLLALRMGLVTLTMISFVLAIVLVEQISHHQDRRMTPTAAQRLQLAEDQQLQASLATDPYRTNADSQRVLYGQRVAN